MKFQEIFFLIFESNDFLLLEGNLLIFSNIKENKIEN